MSLKSFAGDHDSMQFRLVDRLPAPRERVGELGRLSRDATATPSVGRLAGCLPLPSVKSSVSVVVATGGSAEGASFTGNWIPRP
eukprot:3870987-Amphidinium_carterae.2